MDATAVEPAIVTTIYTAMCLSVLHPQQTQVISKSSDGPTDMFERVKAKESSYNSKTLDGCGDFGDTLANFKYTHIKNRCDKCENVKDIFKVLQCKRCTSQKLNNIKPFYEKVKELNPKTYGESRINLIIRVGYLWAKFPNFKYCSVSLDKLNDYMKWIRERMITDRIFWGVAPGTVI